MEYEEPVPPQTARGSVKLINSSQVVVHARQHAAFANVRLGTRRVEFVCSSNSQVQL